MKQESKDKLFRFHHFFTSDKQRIADEKNLTRMDKEFVRTTEQTKITEDDIAKVKVINNAIREKFEQEELRCAAEDETLRVSKQLFHLNSLNSSKC